MNAGHFAGAIRRGGGDAALTCGVGVVVQLRASIRWPKVVLEVACL
jgi:hypothetical protein